MSFFNPYSSFDPELPSFGKPSKKSTSSVRAFNEGVSQNRRVKNGPTPMMRRAAAAGGGWNSDYDAVQNAAKDAWAPYGTKFAETAEDIPRGLPMSRRNAATSSPAQHKIHGGMPPVDMSPYAAQPQQARTPSTPFGQANPVLPSVGQPYPPPAPMLPSEGQAGFELAGAQFPPRPNIVTQPAIIGNRNPEFQAPEIQQASFNVTQTEPSFSDNWGQPQMLPSFEGRFGNIDGSFSSQPDFSFRDAFINQLNNRLQQYQTGGMSGPPVFDIPSLMRGAQDSLEAGFSNPFSASAMPQGFNPSALAGLFG